MRNHDAWPCLQVFNSDAGASAKAEVRHKFNHPRCAPIFCIMQALREACASHTEMIKVASSGAWYDRHLYVNAHLLLMYQLLVDHAFAGMRSSV
jgi:hypothetical protein